MRACAQRFRAFRDRSSAAAPREALPLPPRCTYTYTHTLPLRSLLRHPSYTGWFYWSFATQLLLANPLCTLAYALAAWSFFRHRIPCVDEQRPLDSWRRRNTLPNPVQL